MTARVITELYYKKILGTCYSHKYNHNEEKILHQKVLVNVIDTLSRDKNYRLKNLPIHESWSEIIYVIRSVTFKP